MQDLRKSVSETILERETSILKCPDGHAVVEDTSRVLHKMLLQLSENEEENEAGLGRCKNGLMWSTLTRLMKGGAALLDKLLPDLVIVGAAVDALGGRVGGEVVVDHSTYESSFFEFHGVASNSVSSVSACGYVGMGWKGNTKYMGVEESYSGWFLGAELAQTPPPLSFLPFEVGVGFYTSADNIPSDGAVSGVKKDSLEHNNNGSSTSPHACHAKGLYLALSLTPSRLQTSLTKVTKGLFQQSL